MKMDEIMEYKLKRISKNIMLKEVAEAIGITSGYLSRFEREEDVIMAEERMEMYRKFIDSK